MYSKTSCFVLPGYSKIKETQAQKQCAIMETEVEYTRRDHLYIPEVICCKRLNRIRGI